MINEKDFCIYSSVVIKLKGSLMKYEKIYLPYLFNALEPYIDKETVEIHYTKHLQGA